MRGYDLYKRWDSMSLEQQRQAIGYFMGGPGMDFEGFTDSKRRPEYPHAAYCLDKFEGALNWAEANVEHDSPILRGQVESLKMRSLKMRGRSFLEGQSINKPEEPAPELVIDPKGLGIVCALLLAIIVYLLLCFGASKPAKAADPVYVPFTKLADTPRQCWFRPPFPDNPYSSEPDQTAWLNYARSMEYYGWKPVQTVTLDGALIIGGGRYTAKQLSAEGWKYTRDPFAQSPVEYDCKLWVETGDGL